MRAGVDGAAPRCCSSRANDIFIRSAGGCAAPALNMAGIGCGKCPVSPLPDPIEVNSAHNHAYSIFSEMASTTVKSAQGEAMLLKTKFGISCHIAQN